MPKKLEMKPGDKYGRYTIIKEVEAVKYHRRFLCECECGTRKAVSLANLRQSHTVSCGCYMREVFHRDRSTHGASNTRLYKIWLGIKKRCNNPKCRAYRWYGGRGIKMCSAWEDFAVFREWALSSGYSEHLTIERKDSLGDYRPDNCTWIPWADQPLNSSGTKPLTIKGIMFPSIGAAARHFGVPAPTVYNRLRRGLEGEQAVGVFP